MKNVKNLSKFKKEMVVFCHFHAMNGKWARNKTKLPPLTLTSCEGKMPAPFWVRIKDHHPELSGPYMYGLAQNNADLKL